jgi:CubicO group peptidase (beta-lactamase class C family)
MRRCALGGLVGCALAAVLALAPGCAEPPRPVVSPADLGVVKDDARVARLRALSTRLDEYLHVRRAELRATGAVLGIVLDGELVYAGGVGVRDANRPEPVDADTVFRIASLSKSFTALSVLKLRDEGKLALDEPVARHLSALRVPAGPTADSPPISARQLLTMSSGLPYDDEWGAVSFGLDARGLERLLDGGVSLTSAPGERYAYSNLGYALLGELVAAVSGVSYREYVTTEILRPLGMNASVWEASDVPAARLAIGYERQGEALVAAQRPSDGVFAAAGGLYTSLRDYARYVALQLAAYPARDAPERGPVRRSTLREMHAGQRWSRFGDDVPIARRGAGGKLALAAASYGFGWVNQTSCDYEGIVQHGGFEPGYYSSVRLLPRHGLGVIAFSTTAPLGRYDSFERVLAVLAEGGVLDLPPAPAGGDLRAARGALTRLLTRWDGELVRATFDPQSLEYPWLMRLREDLERLARAHGACEPAGEIDARDALHGRFSLACTTGGIDIDLRLSPARPPRIQAVHFNETFPPSPALGGAAGAVLAAMAPGAAAPLDWLDASVDPRLLKNSLERLRLQLGECKVERPVTSDGSQNAWFLLACSRGPLELGVRVDPGSAKVTRVSARPPARGNLCSEERVLSE